MIRFFCLGCCCCSFLLATYMYENRESILENRVDVVYTAMIRNDLVLRNTKTTACEMIGKWRLYIYWTRSFFLYLNEENFTYTKKKEITQKKRSRNNYISSFLIIFEDLKYHAAMWPKFIVHMRESRWTSSACLGLGSHINSSSLSLYNSVDMTTHGRFNPEIFIHFFVCVRSRFLVSRVDELSYYFDDDRAE
jgi:hypothetical protein